MVGLTQPAVVCFRNEIPKDRDLYAAFLHVDSVLTEYKKVGLPRISLLSTLLGLCR